MEVGPSQANHCTGHDCGMEGLPDVEINGQLANFQATSVGLMVNRVKEDASYQLHLDLDNTTPRERRSQEAALDCARIIASDHCPLFVTERTTQGSYSIKSRPQDTPPRPNLHIVR